MFKKNVKKGIWLSLGILFLVLAFIGLLLPVVPQLSFLLISLFCFMRSSRRINAWIRRQHWFARFHDWAEQQHWFERIKKHLPHHHGE